MDRDHLVARWVKAFSQYDALKQMAEGGVTHWEWTDFPRYDLQPAYFRRYPGRGRVLDSQPEFGGHQYGFDAQDCVLVERIYSNFGDYSEAFFRYDLALVERIQFSFYVPRLPIQVACYTLQDGRVVAYEMFGINIGPQIEVFTPDEIYALTARYNGQHHDRQTYVYEGNRLVRVLRTFSGNGLPPTDIKETLLYDERGRLEQITATYGEASPVITYRRPQKGQTVAALAGRVREQLTPVIVELLRQAAIQEPVYCLSLWYHAVDHYFPPLLAVGLESHRRSLVEQLGSDARFYLYPPLEQGPDLQLELVDPILSTCQLLEQQLMAKNDWDAAARVLRDVAADLLAVDWGAIMPVTDDFVVFAADYEIDDIAEAIAASSGAERLASLQARNLL